MSRLQNPKRCSSRLPRIRLLLSGVAGLFFTASLILVPKSNWASEPVAPKAQPLLCGTLEEMSGEVQLMDSARTRVQNVGPKTGVPCGGWVTVGASSDSSEGSWAVIRHREGPTIHLGAGSFLQLPDNALDGKTTGDQFVLYRGEAFVRNLGTGRELRVITANARARIVQGTALVVYSATEEESQLIALEGVATLENKFQPARRIAVKEGEATSLNFKLLRVVPSTPRAVGLASLRGKLHDFPLNDHVHSEVIRAAYLRQERKFATVLSVHGEARSHGEGQARPGRNSALKNKASPVGEAQALRHWREKHAIRSLASVPPGHPALSSHRHLEVREERPGNQDQEKKRLMEELSRIQPE